MTFISRKPALSLVSLTLVLGVAPAAHSQEFASSVADSSHLSAPYNDPAAALGQPTTLVNGIYDSPPEVYHRSLVDTAYNTDPSGKSLLVKLDGSGQGSLTVKFDTPIVHSSAHWFGEDFLVFGNQGFVADNYPITATTDMSQLHITDGSTYSALPTVSVSADGFNFLTLTPVNSVLFPENPYQWVGLSAQNPTGWDDSHLQDFSKPVNPNLTAGDFAGKTVSYAADALYDGSAGGTAFSLANTPFAATGIEYIRFTGANATVDAVSRVGSPVPEASTFWSFLAGLAGLAVYVIRRRRLAK